MTNLRIWVAGLLAATAATGCLPGSDPIGSALGGLPGLELPDLPIVGVPPIVTRDDDSFTLVGMGGIQSGSLDYGWTCTKPQANLLVGGMTGGSTRIEIRDAAGVVVHDNVYGGGLMGAVTAVTAPDGVPGRWNIKFTFTMAIGISTITIDADVMNDPDAVSIAGMFQMSGRLEYRVGWPAGGGAISVTTALSFGTVRVRVWDGDGALVFDRTAYALGIGIFEEETGPGAAGSWRIVLDIDAAAVGGSIDAGPVRP